MMTLNWKKNLWSSWFIHEYISIVSGKSGHYFWFCHCAASRSIINYGWMRNSCTNIQPPLTRHLFHSGYLCLASQRGFLRPAKIILWRHPLSKMYPATRSWSNGGSKSWISWAPRSLTEGVRTRGFLDPGHCVGYLTLHLPKLPFSFPWKWTQLAIL